MKNKRLQMLKVVVTFVMGVLMLFPMYWTLVTSLKPYVDIFSFPPKLIPNPVSLENWMLVLSLPETLRFVLNSLVVSLGSVIFKLLVATPAAYVLSRIAFRGRDVVAFLFIATVMIPALVVFIPLYVFMAGIQMVNSYFSYILVLTGFGTPFIIWILRAYFLTIPVQLEEAAMVDGCTTKGALVRIVLPLSFNGLGAAAIYGFITAWSDLLIGIIFISSAELRTLPMGLMAYMTEVKVLWGEISVLAILAILPPLILFLLFQKAFLEGMTSGGKGIY